MSSLKFLKIPTVRIFVHSQSFLRAVQTLVPLSACKISRGCLKLSGVARWKPRSSRRGTVFAPVRFSGRSVRTTLVVLVVVDVAVAVDRARGSSRTDCPRDNDTDVLHQAGVGVLLLPRARRGLLGFPFLKHGISSRIGFTNDDDNMIVDPQFYSLTRKNVTQIRWKLSDQSHEKMFELCQLI